MKRSIIWVRGMYTYSSISVLRGVAAAQQKTRHPESNLASGCKWCNWGRSKHWHPHVLIFVAPLIVQCHVRFKSLWDTLTKGILRTSFFCEQFLLVEYLVLIWYDVFLSDDLNPRSGHHASRHLAGKKHLILPGMPNIFLPGMPWFDWLPHVSWASPSW